MAFRSKAQIDSAGASVSTLTVTKPAGTVDGDIVILGYCVDVVSSTPTWPSGFTDLGDASGAISDGSIRFAWKLASGEGANYAPSWSVAGVSDLVALSFSGRSATPFGTPAITTDATNRASPNTRGSITGVTAAAGDDIVVLNGVRANNNANPWVLTPPSGYTVRHDSAANAKFTAVVVASLDNASAGATGTLSETFTSQFDSSKTGIVVVNMAAAGGGGTDTPNSKRQGAIPFARGDSGLFVPQRF